jgi:hypothetical protein
MEVIIAQRRQNSAVLTYSENGAMFPNHGMGSPLEATKDLASDRTDSLSGQTRRASCGGSDEAVEGGSSPWSIRHH